MTFDIPLDFCFPVIGVGFGQTIPALARVSMPETPMYENNFSTRDEHYVRLARQVFPVQSIAIPQPMQKPSHHQLGLGVSALDRAHNPASLLGRRHHDLRMAVGADFRCTSPFQTKYALSAKQIDPVILIFDSFPYMPRFYSRDIAIDGKATRRSGHQSSNCELRSVWLPSEAMTASGFVIALEVISRIDAPFVVVFWESDDLILKQ